MAYNKTEHLRRDIDAIRTAFLLEKEGRTATEAEQEILRSYSGFGAIKEVLEELPLKRNTHLTPLIEELHAVLKENSANDAAYKRYFDSLKASVLTAFYTPPQVTEAIVRILHDQGIQPQRLLEPSAGVGAFVDEIHRQNYHVEATCFEKDALTGLILKHLHPGDHVLVQGFETIDPAYDGYFDLAISNIPFGDVAVFDPAFSTSRDLVRRQGAHALHNYFFMKSVDAVREGGVIAFITSQGVADAVRNRPVREWLMQRCDIISAVRLPNNLFYEYAGTEVGSDLLVLQKKTAQQALSVRQKHFIETRKLSNGISVNNIFRSLDRVVQTSALVATNPYGQPAMVLRTPEVFRALPTIWNGCLRTTVANTSICLYTGNISRLRNRLSNINMTVRRRFNMKRPPKAFQNQRLSLLKPKKHPCFRRLPYNPSEPQRRPANVERDETTVPAELGRYSPKSLPMSDSAWRLTRRSKCPNPLPSTRNRDPSGTQRMKTGTI